MQVVHTSTQEEYDELMDILDNRWRTWCGWDTIKGFNAWNAFKQDTCINISTNLNTIVFSELVYYIKNWYTILSLNDYKKMNDIKECEFKRGEVILVWENKKGNLEERIFLAYIEWAHYQYICVSNGIEEDFEKWNSFTVNMWKYAEKKATRITEEIEKAKKLLIETWEKWSTF